MYSIEQQAAGALLHGWRKKAVAPGMTSAISVYCPVEAMCGYTLEQRATCAIRYWQRKRGAAPANNGIYDQPLFSMHFTHIRSLASRVTTQFTQLLWHVRCRPIYGAALPNVHMVCASYAPCDGGVEGGDEDLCQQRGGCGDQAEQPRARQRQPQRTLRICTR